MTEREALKLALDALENHSAIKHPQQIHYRDKAIAAIKEVLAQPEQEPRNISERWNIERDGDDLLVCFNDHEKSEGCRYERYVPAKAQPEQEHVATSDTSEKRVDEMAKQRHEPEPVIDKSAATRIATSLGWEPKRKPLSEERIDDIWNLHCDEMGYVSVSDAVELARDFEAAHGIKE